MESTDFLPQTVTLNEPDPNSPRWVFFAGDVLAKDRKREFPELAPGGEEVQAVTLVVTKGFVRKGRFTPMVKWYHAEVAEQANMNGRYRPMNEVIPAHETGDRGIYGRETSPLLAVPASPASEIEQVIGSHRGNVRKGIVEVKPLFDVPYERFAETKYQERFFAGKYGTPAFPVKLRELVALIEAAPKGDRDFEETRRLLLSSCEQFRLYGETYLEAENNLVRLPPQQGFVHEYSQVAHTLFEQLEYERVDQHLNKQARANGDIGQALERLVALQEQVAQGNLATNNNDVVAMALAQLKEQREAMERQQQELQALREQLAASVAVGSKPQPQQQSFQKK